MTERPHPPILLTNSSDIYAGGEFYVLTLAAELQRRGYPVQVACRPNNLLRGKCEEKGIPVIPIGFPDQGQLFRYTRELKRIVEAHHAGIVHTNTNYDRTAGAFAARLAGVSHVTNVHSFHSLQHNVTHWIRNMQATDRFIVDGVCVKDLLVRHDGIPEEKIAVVYLGVDPGTMKRDESIRAATRRSFHFGEEHLVIGNVARLVPFKGQEYLIKAFGQLHDRHPSARLVLVGDGECEQDLRALAETLHVSEKILFAGFRDDLAALYSAFDLYVHPSLEGGGETFPFAVLQALAQELPVIVTNVGDVAIMVKEGINGFAVPDRDVGALAEKMRCVLEDSHLRREMSAASRAYLLERFTVARMVDGIESVYRSLPVR